MNQFNLNKKSIIIVSLILAKWIFFGVIRKIGTFLQKSYF